MVHERIEQAGGDPAAVTVVAVTKGFGREAVDEAAAAGVTDFGENLVDQLVAKRDDTHSWHFLGRVQRRDVRRAAGVTMWQSVDRIAAGEEIATRWPGAAVLVQVNVSGEPAKLGCPPDGTAALVHALQPLDLDVRGLMTVGAHGGPDAARPGFATLARLADDLELPVRSMGMSDDLEVAVQEGSTMVRIGRALFGPRPEPPAARR
jgi:pyridoxal phosphate enzyme (YggS family)